ncbi:hypothetical protein ABEB36_013568 [Hypothenemus hampei]|uniref:Uncharacterized protein n=1 Tax=Hypothenemus hampei TaxID=57062 RepID=A0ABD1E4L6_HYPHA
MEEIEESTNGSFCRLCLSTSVVYYSLEKNNGTEMLFSLTGIKIQEDNQYSTESCVKCWLDLKRAYSIQQKFIEFQAKFQLLGLDSIDSKIPETSLKNEKNPEEDISNISDLTNLIKMEVSEIENDSSNDKLELSNNSDDQFDYDELIYIKTNDECPIQIQTNCVICGVKCEDDTALYNHTNNHYNQEQTCDTCLIKLPNISSYRKHIEANHPEEANKTYCCGICTLSFRYLTLYDLHLAAVHPDTARSSKKRNKCNVSRFLTKSDENLTCDHCNKTFISKRSLKSHVKGHVRKPCPICSVEITVYNLSKHISSHTASPVVCHLCGLTSKNPESLRGHMYYTHSQKQIPCEICGRIFKKLYAHKMHMKKEHLGLKVTPD